MNTKENAEKILGEKIIVAGIFRNITKTEIDILPSGMLENIIGYDSSVIDAIVNLSDMERNGIAIDDALNATLVAITPKEVILLDWATGYSNKIIERFDRNDMSLTFRRLGNNCFISLSQDMRLVKMSGYLGRFSHKYKNNRDVLNTLSDYSR